MVLSRTSAHTPELVVPVVSFDEKRIFSREKECTKEWVAKLLFKELSHDNDFLDFPINREHDCLT